MLLLRIFRRILCIIIIIKATVGQRNEQEQQQQQQQHEFMHDSAISSFVRTLLRALPNYDRKSLMHEKYESEKPRHRLEHQHQQPTENGNSLAAKEIAMGILSEMLPANTKSFDDAFKRQHFQEQQQQQQQQPTPYKWQRLNDFSSIETNFRGTHWYAQQKQQQQEMEKLNSENSNWHENAKGLELNANFAPEDDVDDVSENISMHQPKVLGTATHMVHYDNNAGDADTNFGNKFSGNFMKSTPTRDAAATANNAKAVESVFYAPIMMRTNYELLDNMEMDNIMKRNPLSIDDYKDGFSQPRYPFAFSSANTDDSKKIDMNHLKLRSSKRERTPTERAAFFPSISAGAMTNLGGFFGDLSKNVHYNEKHDIHDTKAKLLEGDHPLDAWRREVEIEADQEAKNHKTAQFLHAIRSYRPSQRIRSLVSMTPQGYHGSNFLDPNYMWVGLG